VVANLFQPFHSLIVQGVATILDTNDAQDEQGLIHTVGYSNYRKWMDCNFDRREDFEQVRHKLHSHDIGLYDYIKFVLDIPQMKHFIHLEECHENTYMMISFLMTLHCFKKYNYDNYYQWTDTEMEFNFFNQSENQYNEEMHCNVLQLSKVMHVRPSNDEMVKSSTEDIVVCNLIQDMYEVAQEISLCDWPLTGLHVPPLEKENGLSTGLIQVEFHCMEPNQPCKQWLEKEKALEISCFLVYANNVKEVRVTNANVTLLAFEYIITQYCISRGYIVINDDDHLFRPFHELAVELIHHISDSFYSNPDGKDKKYLSEWLECDFDGDKPFSVVSK
jgi:hypothetical protein